MNHRLIITFVILGIVAAIVGGVVSWEWKAMPTRPTEVVRTAPQTGASSTSTTSRAQNAASSSMLAVPVPMLGPESAEAAGETASATPTIIAVNEPTNVTVTVKITDTRLIAGSVNLQRLDAAGKVIASLGPMNDSGTNGDVVAGDKTFTIRIQFLEAGTNPIRLRVSWALKGLLRRAISDVMIVDVAPRVAVNESAVSFTVPPQLVAGEGSHVASTSRPDGTTFVEIRSAPSGQPLKSTVGIVLSGNSPGDSLEVWFASHVDIGGVLTVAGVYVSESLADGRRMLVFNGPVPQGYDGVPLPRIFVMSPDRSKVASLSLSQDHDLDLLGYPTSDARMALLRSIAVALAF